MHRKQRNYRGVYEYGSKWRVKFTFKKESHYVGDFDTEKDAAKIFDIFMIKIYGAKADTNFVYSKQRKENIMKFPLNS